ncbi:DUF2946 family protein [Aminobacter aganoensis]|uniref:DUF2946 domain-containing protein n=1 Tax=Aminobacter aganoensis TaxID=83264 RepID=A0A7X0F9Y7_9HYPH|nr:DUF2946 family protein [Aminobacter aganoensis]MBB6355826.1 hypothetical protein [Aminobacter aganoensis]
MRMVALWAMLLPFVLSSFVAQGFMPARGADGVITMVICTGNGMVEMAFDAVTMDPVDETASGNGEKSASAYCALAAVKPAAALTLPIAFALPVPPASAVKYSRREAVLEYAAATGLPHATGPPYPV